MQTFYENSPTASHDDNILISENPSHNHMVSRRKPCHLYPFGFQLIFPWRKPVLIRNPFTPSHRIHAPAGHNLDSSFLSHFFSLNFTQKHSTSGGATIPKLRKARKLSHINAADRSRTGLATSVGDGRGVWGGWSPKCPLLASCIGLKE